MNRKQEDFLKELLADFKVEAAEHHEVFVSCLLELEKPDTGDHQPIVEKMFREIHSLKGAARAVSLLDIERFCQSMENVLSLVKQDKLEKSKSFFDEMHDASDLLKEMLENLEKGKRTVKAEVVANLIIRLESMKGQSTQNALNDLQPPANPDQKTEQEMYPELSTSSYNSRATVRITTEKLSSILTRAEELVIAKAYLHQYSGEIKSLLRKPSLIPDELPEISKKIDLLDRSSSRIIDDLLVDIKQTLLTPFSFITSNFPKIARDIAKDLGKEVHLSISGENIEIDKRILEGMKDPLIHILRNCIDHGIEQPVERRHFGKPDAGTISLEISQTPDNKITQVSH